MPLNAMNARDISPAMIKPLGTPRMDLGIRVISKRSRMPAINTKASMKRKPAGAAQSVQPATAAETVRAAREAADTARQGEQPLEEAVSSIQQFVQTVQRNLNFSLDDSTGRVVVKVTDGASGEVIRQIPSEEALRLAESLEQARSLLFKAEA